MRRKILTIALLAAALALALSALRPAAGVGGRVPPPPPQFFGIAPQDGLTSTDAEYMRAARIGSIRAPVLWGAVQPTPRAEYNWSELDKLMEFAAQWHFKVLPFLYGTPAWLGRPTTLPVGSGRARRAWSQFLTAAVRRYEPGGEFWSERAPGVVKYEPAIPEPAPIREWQIWNEANFWYFARPASPTRYAKLLKISSRAIRAAEPSAKIMLSGLFGNPNPDPPNGMDASEFLERLYRVPGIKAYFDGIALHPYAETARTLESMTEEMREVALENHDPGARLYVTEMGWGSQDDPNVVSFERGMKGQAKELRAAYSFLIENRGRLNLKGTYWFSWRDAPPGVCNFCDSVGLFHRGKRVRPKPAWHAFVRITGGRARP